MNTEQYCSRHYARYRTGEREITVKDIRDILYGSKDKQIYFPAHFIFELLHNFFLSVLENNIKCYLVFSILKPHNLVSANAQGYFLTLQEKSIL